MPAAAVIPAPRVYIHVAAVKMFVVEYKCRPFVLNDRKIILLLFTSGLWLVCFVVVSL